MDISEQAARYGSRHYINGTFTAAGSSRTGAVLNPSTGKEIYRTAYADRAAVDAAAQAAGKAGREWGNASQAKRLSVIFRMRELMLQNTDKLAEITGLENGKTISDAKGELGRAMEAVEFGTNAPQVSKGEYSRNVGGGIDTFSFRQPVGVVGCIAPFNFPIMVPMMMGTMAIAVGNAVILKPSERVPGAAALLAELWEEAGLPSGVWNVVNGDSEAVDAILEHPKIPAISFVGSTRVGEHIYQHGSKHNKSVAAYTGGKNHMVVLPDADLDAAASAFVAAAYGSSSQRCMAVSLLVCVGDDTAQKLQVLVRDRIAQLKVGAYDDPAADFGPLITQTAKDAVEHAIEQAISEGGEIICDGRGTTVQGHEDGFFAGATLIDKVTTGMRLWKEEIFGPVRGMMRADSLDDAIEIVNAHQYGNGAVIFTRSGAAAQTFCAEVEAGMLGVNVPVPVPVGHHNFGGLRRSKFGDAHMFGPDAARFYTKLKTVSQRWPNEAAPSAKLSLDFPSNS